MSRKDYKCYNIRLKKIVEAIDVKFNESSIFKSKIEKKDHHIYEIHDRLKKEEESSGIEETKPVKNENLIATSLQGSTPSMKPSKRFQRNHLEEQIIVDIDASVETRSKRKESTSNQEHVSLLSLFKPKNVQEAINDENWMKAMKEEISQLEKNKTWELVPRPLIKMLLGLNGFS